MKLRELCNRLHINYDLARNAMAHGVIPSGVAAAPGKGNHRDFTPEQAFRLALALKLKVGGVRLATAQQITAWSWKVQEFAVHGGWDPQFAPFSGTMRTKHRWYLEVGDGQCVRIVTDASPSDDGLYATPWTDLRRRKLAPKGFQPSVVVQLDVSRLARLLSTKH